MPIYEYKCDSCETVSEVMQKMSDDPLTVCAECGGPLQRLISPSAFHFKGGGWYKDLYASTRSGDGKGEGATGSSAADSKDKAASSDAATPSTASASSADSKAPAASGTSSSGSGSAS